MRRVLLPFSFVVTLAACGAAEAEALDPQVPAPASVASVTPSPSDALPAPSASIKRDEVRAVVRGGLGAFLRKVDLEEQPVFRGGKFVGFKIAALKGDGWKGVDLKPGDVVTQVNGYPIEHPEDAAAALKSLEVASELRVDYERGGEARSLRYAIVDE
jgi:type II secretory pathway component PulC